MNILLVTSSARGHALGEALVRSHHKPDVINVCASRNPGLRKICAQQYVQNVMDFASILDIAKRSNPEFAVIGPDDPIGGGLADELEAMGVPCVAPKKSLARLESSKGFTRDLMKKYGINASPKYRFFTRTGNSGGDTERREIHAYIQTELQGNYVVKYDALKGGKGVKVSGEHLQTVEEGVAYAVECLDECGRVVIEERLIGVEFSLLSFVSGAAVVDMPAVQDHKRAYEGDTGGNTGGMGTYTDANHSLPFLQTADLEQASMINRKIAAAVMQECKAPYKGILYGGFIAVKDGVRVIEYNARFGDPEALNILPLLKTDFVDLCRGIVSGELDVSMAQFERKATVCKYIVPKSYPEAKTEKGQTVTFPAMPANARLYYGDIAETESGALQLGGSRTAGIVGIGNTIAEAESIAEKLCEQVQGPVRFRKDVGTAELIQKRTDTMKTLRG